MTDGLPPPGNERQQLVADSNRRWRTLFGALALVLPLLVGGLFERQSRRLRALVDHGEMSPATVLRRRPGDDVTYEYEVDGRAYRWSVRSSELPSPVGAVVPITYLPEDPSLSRVGAPYSRASYDRERGRGAAIPVVVPGGLFLFFAGASLLCHRALRRHERGLPPVPGRVVDPTHLGYGIATCMLFALIVAVVRESSQVVFRKLWGDAPLGVPLLVVTLLAQVALFVPYFALFPALMRIVQARPERERTYTAGGVALALFHAGPEQRRDRVVVLAGVVYFVVLCGAWIAYAAAHGV